MSESANQPDYLAEAQELIDALLLTEQLDASQQRRLEELATEHPEVRHLYVAMMHQRCVISAMAWPASASLSIDAEAAPAENRLDETLVTRAMHIAGEAEPALAAPTFRQEARQRRERELIRQQRIRWISTAAAVAIALGLGILALLLLRQPATRTVVSSHPRPGPLAHAPTPPPLPTSTPTTTPAPPPPPPALATLVHQIGAHWGGDRAPAVDQAIAANDQYQLVSGLAQIRFSTGTTMIVEGPADFAIASNSTQLRSGRLAANVPPSGHGFAVFTPQSKVIDHGTELGVEVHGAVTEVDVFKGTVEAQPAKNASAPVMLTVGGAATVTANAVALQPQGAQPQQFVRQLSSNTQSLDVVDLICGGVGTHLRGKGINPQTGEYGPIPPLVTMRGDHKFHSVGAAIVDGAFIPEQRTVIDSAGDSFDFGTTSARTFCGIDAGNPTPWQPSATNLPLTTTLSGIDYAGSGHGFLLVHASSGLTLDLAKIRRLFPDKSLSRFTAVTGNTCTHKRRDKTVPTTTAMVLVDGQVRSQRTFTPADGGLAVEVPLTDSDRFLTLATVERRVNTEYDWVIFGDPVIDLKPRN